MERRNRSINALEELKDIESFNTEQKATSLINWVNRYIPSEHSIKDFDLDDSEIELLLELLYKNIDFIKHIRDNLKQELIQMRNLKKFIPYT
jgi:hypothetical protein